MDVLIGIVVVVFGGIGAATVYNEMRKWLMEKPRFATDPATPKPDCIHEWEPWSEPKDCDVKESAKPYSSFGERVAATEKTFVGKFQDRVCSKCNIYGRRWA